MSHESLGPWNEQGGVYTYILDRHVSPFSAAHVKLQSLRTTATAAPILAAPSSVSMLRSNCILTRTEVPRADEEVNPMTVGEAKLVSPKL
jgi:hypothetical protein